MLIATTVIIMTITAYAPACGGINGKGTHYANGERVSKAHHMNTAACGKKWKFGTVFEVPGLGTFICRDRGGWVGPNSLDVLVYTGDCKADHKAAMQIGRKKMEVKVYAAN